MAFTSTPATTNLGLFTAILLFEIWALAAHATAAHAQSFPAKPVRLIVPYPAGGANDIVARIIGEKLTGEWPHPVVVENRSGAAGIIAMELVSRAQPDGHTMILIAATQVVNKVLYKKLPYDPVRNFTPITLIGSTPNVLVVHPSVPARSVKELIGLAKAKPGRLTYASAGQGTGGHLAAELFKTMAGGIDVAHIPYQGGGPAFTALMGGHVDVMFNSTIGTVPHAKAGRVRALAVTGVKRSHVLPDVPTVAEAGVSGYEAELWFGVLTPVGAPQSAITESNARIVRILGMPDVSQRFSDMGLEIVGSTPEQFAAYIDSEITKWGQVAKKAGVVLDY